MRQLPRLLLLLLAPLAGCADAPAADGNGAGLTCPEGEACDDADPTPATGTPAASAPPPAEPTPSPPAATPEPAEPTAAEPAPTTPSNGGDQAPPDDGQPILFEGKYSRQAGGYIDTYSFFLDGSFQLESWNFVSGNTYYEGAYDLRQGILQFHNGETRALAAYADFSSVFVDGEQYYRG